MLHPIVDQSYHDCVTRGNKSCTIVLCIRNLRTKKNCCCNSSTSTIHWIEKKKICSVCTTCFCSGCGFGRVDAFLIQGYLRETYLPIGGPKLYKLKGSKTLVVSLQDRFSNIGFFWIWELLPRGQNKGQLISVTNWRILFWLFSTTFLIWTLFRG